MADMEEVCAEFSRNFSALELRYKAAEQQIEAEKDNVARHVRVIEELRAQIVKQQEEHASLRQELQDMSAYKEKFFQASVTVEHLKGRLESARAGIADKEREHQHELEQMKAQMGDLHKRIEVSADVGQVAHLRQQRTELEERCALITGQLLEMKESSSHSQIASNSALRDLNARNIELEQRCRALEQETAQVRAQMRRASEAQIEATLARDKYELERSRQAIESESLKKELLELRSKMAEQQAEHQAQLAQRQLEADGDKEQLLNKLSEGARQLEAALQQRASDDEKLAAANRNAASRVAATREECQLELDQLQEAKAQAQEEASRARWRLKQVEQQLTEAQAAQQEANARATSAEQQREQLHSQLEIAVQQESWASAEKDHMNAQIAQLVKELDAAAAAKRSHEATIMELERAKMQLRYNEVDLAESQKRLDRAVSQVANVEQVYSDKVQRLTRDMKDMKKAFKTQMQRSDQHKKKLTTALIRKDHEIAAANSPSRHRAVSATAAGNAGASGSGERSPILGSAGAGQGVNVMQILKDQTEAAERLQESLQRLQ